jgi:hypothetical protein
MRRMRTRTSTPALAYDGSPLAGRRVHPAKSLCLASMFTTGEGRRTGKQTHLPHTCALVHTLTHSLTHSLTRARTHSSTCESLPVARAPRSAAECHRRRLQWSAVTCSDDIITLVRPQIALSIPVPPLSLASPTVRQVDRLLGHALTQIESNSL